MLITFTKIVFKFLLGKLKNKIIKKISQTNYGFYFMCYFFLRNYNFKFIKKTTVDMVWGKAICLAKINIPINNLYGSIRVNGSTKSLKIGETPHYSYINSDGKDQSYIEYKLNNFDHFDKSELKKRYEYIKDLTKIEPVEILIKKDSDLILLNKGKIIDGLHRSAILKYNGVEFLTCLIVDRVIVNNEHK